MVSLYLHSRHCEEQRDEAIHIFFSGLPRFLTVARNDREKEDYHYG